MSQDPPNREPAAFSPALALAPLFLVQFFAWSGMFVLWIYALPVIGGSVLGGLGRGGETGGEAMHRGVIAVALCFAYYATLAALLAFLIPRLRQRWGAPAILGCALLTGSAGLAAIGFIHTAGLLIPCFTALAVGWSALSNLPYAMVDALVPEERLEHYFRVFSFSSVIPQVSVTLTLALAGVVVSAADSPKVMIAGGFSMALAGGLALVFRGRLGTV